jgi:1-deoxyxylulose-5-phosphate synthase
MQYKLLGNTGVKVSRLCLGCMSYGDPRWRPWVLDRQAAMPFFRLAVESGINFFDTADMYSLGVSEEITGAALREYAPLQECVIATKVFNAMGPGPNMSGLSRKHIQQGCEASLRRLGVETIDLYQVHRFDPDTPVDEMLSALEGLVRQGKVRYLGASSTAAWKFAQSLSISERHGWARFVSMQNHYNLVYREEEREMIPLCEQEKIAVMPWSPLARGLLAGSRRAADDRESTVRASSDDYARKL